MSEFFSMSGYGEYVWSCYALTLVVLVGNVWAARRQLREQISKTQRRQLAQGESQL